jgi:hypothetical protein
MMSGNVPDLGGEAAQDGAEAGGQEAGSGEDGHLRTVQRYQGTTLPLLPDSPIFCQISHKRPQKTILVRKKLEAVKLQIFANSDKKRDRKTVLQYLEAVPFNYLYFLSKEYRVKVNFPHS